MKKISKFLTIVCFAIMLVTSVSALSACKDKDPGSSGQTPVYQGMTITNNTYFLNSKPKNNQNHNIFDCNEHNHGVDSIENKIDSTLDVVRTDKDIYYAYQNDYVYVNIHLSNPDNFEILSFTLNGKKYSGYMFEDGSNMEKIILKVNVGDKSGIINYTIDAIKYVDKTEIKDVIMDGDKTVRVGIHSYNQIKIDVERYSGYDNILLNIKIEDNKNIIAFSNGFVKVALYDGENIVEFKDLKLGDNIIKFNNLSSSSYYQYSIFGYYDNLDGRGFALNVLEKRVITTKTILSFSNVVANTEGVTFGLKWNEEYLDRTITGLAIYGGETVVTQLNPSATSVDGLLSNKSYKLVASILHNNNTEYVSIDFTTLPKSIPTFTIDSITSTSTSISFDVDKVDVHNVGEITKIELYKGQEKVSEAESVEQDTFDGLDSNTEYTIKAYYSYNLNDGNPNSNGSITSKIYTKLADTKITYKPYGSGEYVFYYTVESCDQTATEVKIETQIAGIPVTKIEDRAFYGCDKIKEITIPEEIYDIGSQIFLGCTSLETVYYNSSYAPTEGNTFLKIDSLKEVIFGDNLTRIPNYICYNCTSLERVILSKNTRTIGNYAFYQCKNLRNLDLPSGIYELGWYSFHSSGLRTLIVPEGVKTIDNTFRDCYSLTSVALPKSLLSIVGQSFYGCSKIKNVYYMGNQLDWSGVNITEDNSYISNANIHFVNGDGLEHTYSFNSNGGSECEDITAIGFVNLPVPKKNGCVFVGWYDNPELIGESVPFPYYSGSDRTFYVKWEALEEYYNGTTRDRVLTINISEPKTITLNENQEYLCLKFIPDEDKDYVVTIDNFSNTIASEWLYGDGWSSIMGGALSGTNTYSRNYIDPSKNYYIEIRFTDLKTDSITITIAPKNDEE